MINSPHDKEFVFQNGERAKNLVELVHTIENLTDHGFNHFVNHSKNDFANWIEHVLKDNSVSEKLRSTHSKDITVQILKDRIVELYEESNKISFGSSIVHPHKKVEELKYEEKHKIREENIGVKKEHKLEDLAINKIEHKTVHQENDFNRDNNANNKNTHNKEESKNHKKWFKIFSKKNSDANLSRIELAREINVKAERELTNEIVSDDRENTLWVVLYFALISLISILLVYRIFFH